jgi:hypothetical protein
LRHPGGELHPIGAALSFPAGHTLVDIHFAPTHSSSFTQAELQSGWIDRDVTAYDVLDFVSVQKRKLWNL